jgi:hypothetical protein
VSADQFEPREYQQHLADAVQANVAQGRNLTVGLAAPGYGKQNAAIYVAISLAREHGIPLKMTFVPRLNLAGQYEIGYEGPYMRQGRRVYRDRTGALIGAFTDPRLNHLEHRPNADPLVPEDWRPPFGLVACYASLVKDMGPDGNGYFRSLAQEYSGRFLLHADEAQFCGVAEYGEGDAITGGARAGIYVEELSRYAFHTLLQTGTENRADEQPLVLCGDRYADPQKPGEIYGPLIPDAEGTYGRARQLGYLREFEIDYIDDHVQLESLDGKDRAEYELSQSPKYLAAVLRREAVWQPLCDKVVQRVRERQKIWGGYKGLICCMDQNHAEAVRRYLQGKYPGLKDRILQAISREQGDALANLRKFRDRDDKGRPSPYDILITVRMAFIGYDCKEISVVGILTNYRDRGHLYQQVGRGLRVLPERAYQEQVCWLVAPKDPLMRSFIQWLKEERKRGIRGPGDGPGDFGEPKMLVKDAYATTVTADSLTGSVDNPAEYAEIERLRAELGIYEPATRLKRLKDIWSGATTLFDADDAPAPAGAPTSAPKTSKEQVSELNGDVREAGVKALARCGVLARHPRYGEAMNWFYDKVASLSYWASDAKTPERAQERLDAAEKVLAAVRERGELWW